MSKRKEASESGSSKKKNKKLPNDAMWCLNNVESLDIKAFTLQFGLFDRHYSSSRYRTIVDKYFDQDAKDALLNDLKQWNSSIESTRFWKERACVKTIVETRSACSKFVNKIIVQEAASNAAFANRSASSAGQSADDEVHNNSQDDINGRGDTDVETPIIPCDHNCSTNAALDMPWLVNNTNIAELFREYQCQARATQQLFQLETDMQEVLSLSLTSSS